MDPAGWLSSFAGAACVTVSLAALSLAAFRLASSVSPAGAERILATATGVAAAAVIAALTLGVIGLGSSQVALTAAAIAIAAGARALLPAPATPLGGELRALWEGAGTRSRALLGASLGVALAWAGFALLRPTFDLDSALYDLPQITVWIHNGHPGSIELINFRFPIGNYPLTNEVLMTWLGALSRNVGFVLIWPLAAGGLLLLAIRTALRALGCGSRVATLAPLVVLGVPIVAESVTSLDSDLASTAWIAVSVALCARVATSRARPEVLGFAIVALALAVGTKTTVAPLGLLALCATLYAGGRRPRPAPIGVALAIAVAVGGVWYLRNFVDHGSPLWPFMGFPGSDPLPDSLDYLSAPFIADPLDTLDNRIGTYLGKLGAGPLLIAAAVLLPVLTRDRKLMLGSAAVLGSFLLWSLAPATGEPEGSAAEFFQVSGARYLMPTIMLATGVVAVMADRLGSIAIAARAVLAVAATWGVVDLVIGRDGVPPAWILPLAAALGALAALWFARSGSRGSGPVRARLIAAGGALVACVLLAGYPGRFLERFANPGGTVEDPLEDARASFGGLAEWFDGQPAFREDADPVVFTDVMVGPLTGGAFEHDLVLIGADPTCDQVESLGSGTWAVVGLPATGEAPPIAGCFSEAELQTDLATPGGGSVLVFRRASAP